MNPEGSGVCNLKSLESPLLRNSENPYPTTFSEKVFKTYEFYTDFPYLSVFYTGHLPLFSFFRKNLFIFQIERDTK